MKINISFTSADVFYFDKAAPVSCMVISPSSQYIYQHPHLTCYQASWKFGALTCTQLEGTCVC